jgi:hypothetical protein
MMKEIDNELKIQSPNVIKDKMESGLGGHVNVNADNDGDKKSSVS